MSDKKKKQMSESFVLGMILSLAGGYFDAYTYIARDGVFANAQTGNVVLFGIALASGDFIRSLRYIPPILAFLLGVFLAEYLRRHNGIANLHWRQYVILLELIIILIVTFLPSGSIDGINYDMISNILISFVCSLQVQSFRRIRGITCATTMCTGNLRSAAEDLIRYVTERDKKLLHGAGKYFAIVGIFVAGAVISTFVTRLFGTFAVAFTAAGLLAVFLMMFVKPDTGDDAGEQ